MSIRFNYLRIPETAYNSAVFDNKPSIWAIPFMPKSFVEYGLILWLLFVMWCDVMENADTWIGKFAKLLWWLIQSSTTCQTWEHVWTPFSTPSVPFKTRVIHFSEYVQTKQLSSCTATTNTRKSSCTRPYYDTRVNNNDWKTHELFSDGNTHSTQHITVVKSLRTDTVLYCVKNGFPNSGELLSMIGTRLCLNQEPRWPPKLPSNRSPFYDPNQGLSYRS